MRVTKPLCPQFPKCHCDVIGKASIVNPALSLQYQYWGFCSEKEIFDFLLMYLWKYQYIIVGKWLDRHCVILIDLSFTLTYFWITSLSAGTSLRAESEVQGGEVYHRAVPHDKGQRLGLRGKSSSFFMTFFKSCIPSTIKGSSVASSSRVRAIAVPHFHFVPRIACDAFYLFRSSCFSSDHDNTFADISLSQLLVVLGHGLNECRVCVWTTGTCSRTGVCVCVCACWVLKACVSDDRLTVSLCGARPVKDR